MSSHCLSPLCSSMVLIHSPGRNRLLSDEVHSVAKQICSAKGAYLQDNTPSARFAQVVASSPVANFTEMRHRSACRFLAVPILENAQAHGKRPPSPGRSPGFQVVSPEKVDASCRSREGEGERRAFERGARDDRRLPSGSGLPTLDSTGKKSVRFPRSVRLTIDRSRVASSQVRVLRCSVGLPD